MNVERRMSPVLLEAIASSSVRTVATHWLNARAGRRMPAWEDLKPRAIAPQLSLVWALKYDAATDTFTGRLAGDRIARLIRKDFRGLPLEQAQTQAAYGAMQPILKRVVTEPAIYLGKGNIFQHENAFFAGERLLLPLATGGADADGLLGATEYAQNEAALAEVQPAVDTSFWFDLNGNAQTRPPG